MPLSFWKKKQVSLNSARSFIGYSVNLHLTDGSVLINVKLESVTAERRLKCRAASRKPVFVALCEVVEIRLPPLSFLQEMPK